VGDRHVIDEFEVVGDRHDDIGLVVDVCWSSRL
jgi:hypothetical protein